CNDGWRIGIPAMRFTAMTDLATTLITALHKTSDGTIFRAIVVIIESNFRITGGYWFFWGLYEIGLGVR
ncbi:MAG TPA: hypothetical protein DCW42_06810, partial [Bacteroidetes bacterium]|nr:hypothetical protein [Bacteroidota bacterium]